MDYQSVVQIVVETLLQWDTKKQKSRGKGIIGILEAFTIAHEEQGRKTCHGHCQVWTKELNQALRDAMMKSEEKKEKFREKVDAILSAEYPDLEVTHICNGTEVTGLANEIYEDVDTETFRQARHKDMCHDVSGLVMQCKKCHQKTRTVDVVNLALNEWRKTAFRDVQQRERRTDTQIPLSNERLDIAAYTYSYHMDGGCDKNNDPFWGDQRVRKTLLRLRFDEHRDAHCSSCFKKNCECRFFFPFLSQKETCIYEDPGENDANVVPWHQLDGTVLEACPFLVLPKRPMGCQFLNTHCDSISSLLNCNTNMQTGDASQVWYSTLYGSKDNQPEDSERQQRIGHQIIKRLLRMQNEVLDGTREQDDDPGFAEGLCRMLSGMNAATSRTVISSTMAHLIVSYNGTRFVHSHDFVDLLVSQLEAALEGREVNVRLRTNAFKGKSVTWQDSSADDYIHRPNNDELEDACFYQMAMNYKKVFKTFKETRADNKKDKDEDKEKEEDDDDEEDDGDSETGKHCFLETHPGHHFAYLTKLKRIVIPKVSLPQGKLCNIEELELNSHNPTSLAKEKREDYAKFALLMFHPFRNLDDLKTNGSYWTTFNDARNKRFHTNSTSHTKFWKEGFRVLQNIQNRMTLDKRVKRARDPVVQQTDANGYKLPDQTDAREDKEDDDNMVQDILQFCQGLDNEDNGDGFGLDDIKHDELRLHSEIIGRSKFGKDKFIDARLSSGDSIFGTTNNNNNDSTDVALGNGNGNANQSTDIQNQKTFATMLRLIGGSLVGKTDYDDIYQQCNEASNDLGSTEDSNSHDMRSQGTSQNTTGNTSVSVPTLAGVAQKMAMTEKVQLDEKQHIAYEIISCTFLLQLIQEGPNGESDLGQHLQRALSTSEEDDMNDLVAKLKARGGLDQLIMFVPHWPCRSRKAQQ